MLEINGATLDFDNSALAGSDFGIVGGVSVHSSTLVAPYRSVKLDGVIHTIAFVGQELTVDSIELAIVPEPAMGLLTIVSCASLLAYRGRRHA